MRTKYELYCILSATALQYAVFPSNMNTKWLISGNRFYPIVNFLWTRTQIADVLQKINLHGSQKNKFIQLYNCFWCAIIFYPINVYFANAYSIVSLNIFDTERNGCFFYRNIRNRPRNNVQFKCWFNLCLESSLFTLCRITNVGFASHHTRRYYPAGVNFAFSSRSRQPPRVLACICVGEHFMIDNYIIIYFYCAYGALKSSCDSRVQVSGFKSKCSRNITAFSPSVPTS